MDIKLQYIVLGVIYSGKYSFNKRTNELIGTQHGKAIKPFVHNGKMSYRFALGYSHRIEAPMDECVYLFNYGVFNPNAKVIHKDGDTSNNLINNLTLSIEGNEIPQDIKAKITKLFSDGKGYSEIGRLVNVDMQSVKRIVQAKFGSVHARQYVSTKSLVDSMKRDMNGFRIK